jgi:hypothetical protein
VLVTVALVTTLVGATQASGQSRTIEFTGSVTSFSGTPTPAAPDPGIARNSVSFQLTDSSGISNDTLSGELRVAFEGALFDENNSSLHDVCIGFDLIVDGAPLEVAGTSAETISYQAKVSMADTSSTDHGCSGAPDANPPIPADLEFTLEGDTMRGTITFGTDKVEFKANRVGDTGFTNFLEGSSVSSDVIKQALDKSTCTSTAIDQDFAAQPPDCQIFRTLGASFDKEFANDFTDKEVLIDLTAAVMLRSLTKPDGSRLLPMLNRLIKPIALLAVKASSEGDESAKLAMRRLINIAIALDLDANS